MAFLKKKVPPPPEPCPACGEPLTESHCDSHTREVAGGHIFVCACGVSTMKWPSATTAAMGMELHLDRDHHTHVSRAAGSSVLDVLYRKWFPDGAVQPHPEGQGPEEEQPSGGKARSIDFDDERDLPRFEDLIDRFIMTMGRPQEFDGVLQAIAKEGGIDIRRIE